MHTATAKIAAYCIKAPDICDGRHWSNGKDRPYTPHPELQAISDDLQANAIDLAQAADRARDAHNRLQSTANEMTLARLRCVAKRSLRAAA